MICETAGYWTEGVRAEDTAGPPPPPPASQPFGINGTDYQFYRDNFLHRDHVNMLCMDSEVGPVCISYRYDSEKQVYYGMVRYSAGRAIRFEEDAAKISSKCFGLGGSEKQLVEAMLKTLPFQLRWDQLRRCDSVDLEREMLQFDEKLLVRGLKFGLVYAAPGQRTEEEMLANQTYSPRFEEFLQFLGQRVRLKSWSHFRAGLDVRADQTGEYSVWHMTQEGVEVMWHVAPFLPYSEKDTQQLERKRHIGNDQVVVVFKESAEGGPEEEWRPSCFASRQIQCVLIVRPVSRKGKTAYRLQLVARDGVPRFPPKLEPGRVYKRNAAFLRFLYEKLINAERASYQAPECANERQFKILEARTRAALLNDICKRFLPAT